MRMRRKKRMQRLKPINIGGWECLVNKDLGYAPYFSNEISKRINAKLANNIVVTGEAGITKSLTATSFCRVQNNRFSIDDVVFTYSQYMEQILRKRRKGVPIMFDEPQYALDKRDWFKDAVKALVKTITSQRFRLRPLYIPIINLSLLEKTLRSYLIQYHVIMVDKGIGHVYRMYPSQTDDKIYRYKLCKIEYGLFDKNICDKDCLDPCMDLPNCNVFRAQYERKKEYHQNQHDRQALEEAVHKEAKVLTEDYLVNLLYENVEELRNNKGKIDTNLTRIFLKNETGLRINRNKALYLRTLLFHNHPELAPIIEDIS